MSEFSQDVEAEPALAGAVFGDSIDKACAYVGHLASTGVEWGLLGPRELPRLWTRHVLNCAVVGSLVGPEDVVGDVGSGAGLPGLCLALAKPDTRFVLVEPMSRRVEWLEQVVEDLDLGNVRVVRGRVEELEDDEMFTVVTSRAVKPLNVLIDWCVPVMGPEARLLAIKGASVDAEITKAAKMIKRNKLVGPQIHKLDGTEIARQRGSSLDAGTALEVPTTVVELRRR